MPNLGTTELLIIFGICVLLFGANRIGRIGTELGEGIRGLRRGLEEGITDDDERD